MKIDGSVFLCVRAQTSRRLVPQSTKHCHPPRDLLGARCQSKRKEGRARSERNRERERDYALCYLSITKADCFLLTITAQLILGSPLKGIIQPTWNITLCVERLIKYWLQTYMNLPHQIEAPVGGLPLIRCVWYGNESRKQQGLLCTTHFLCC